MGSSHRIFQNFAGLALALQQLAPSQHAYHFIGAMWQTGPGFENAIYPVPSALYKKNSASVKSNTIRSFFMHIFLLEGYVRADTKVDLVRFF